MKHILYTFLAITLLFSGCNYLDVVPEEDVRTIETIFEQRAEVDEWLAGLYAGVVMEYSSARGNSAFLGSDEFVTNEHVRNGIAGFKIAAGQQMSQIPYNNVWDAAATKVNPSMYESIRSCNIFLENIDRVYNMSLTEKRQWSAEVKALKAFIYHCINYCIRIIHMIVS